MTITFRPASPTGDDREFVVSTWSSSWKGSHYAGVICAEDWATIMRPQFAKHLDKSGTRTIIACEDDDPNYFYGWIAGDPTERPPVVHYVYVKQPYRRHGYKNGVRIGDGIARQLFAALGVDPTKRFVYTCGSPTAVRMRDKIPLARLNPNGLRYTKETRRDPL